MEPYNYSEVPGPGIAGIHLYHLHLYRMSARRLVSHIPHYPPTQQLEKMGCRTEDFSEHFLSKYNKLPYPGRSYPALLVSDFAGAYTSFDTDVS